MIFRIILFLFIFIDSSLAEIITKVDYGTANYQDTIYASVSYDDDKVIDCDINFDQSKKYNFKVLSRNSHLSQNGARDYKQYCCIDFSIKSTNEIYGEQQIEPGSLIVNKVEHKIPKIKINFLKEKKEKVKIIQKFSKDKIKLSETAEYILEILDLPSGEKLALDDLSSPDFTLSFKNKLNQNNKSKLIYDFKPNRVGQIKVKNRKAYGLQACKRSIENITNNEIIMNDAMRDAGFEDLFSKIETKELFIEVPAISIIVEK